MLGFSNWFLNLAPKRWKAILHHESWTILNNPNHLYFLFLLYIYIGNLPLLHSPPSSFYLQIGRPIGTRIFPRNWFNFQFASKKIKIGSSFNKLLEMLLGFNVWMRCFPIEMSKVTNSCCQTLHRFKVRTKLCLHLFSTFLSNCSYQICVTFDPGIGVNSQRPLTKRGKNIMDKLVFFFCLPKVNTITRTSWILGGFLFQFENTGIKSQS